MRRYNWLIEERSMVNWTEIQMFMPLVTAVGYFLLLLWLFVRRREPLKQAYWLMMFVGMSIMWQLGVYLWPSSGGMRAQLQLIPLLWSVGLLYFNTSIFLGSRPRQPVMALILLGLPLAIPFVDELIPPTYLRWSRMLIQPTPAGLTAVGLWAFGHLFTLAKTWRSYRHTPFPWHANRYLFWASGVVLVIVGEVLLFIDYPITVLVGHVVRLTAVGWLVYAVSAYVRFDVRSRFQRIVLFAIIALASAIPATAVFLLFTTFTQTLNPTYTTLIAIAITSLAFLLYMPYRNLIERTMSRFLIGTAFQTNRVIRSYTQEVSRALEMEQLATVIISFIANLFGINRGALILVTAVDDGYQLEPIPAMGQVNRRAKLFPASSPFLTILIEQHQPILQYEIDFNPDFAAVKREAGDWLAEQQMEMYIPISSGKRLAGIIALGPKGSARTYRANEIETVQLMADQTVAPLENARLYATLENQNEKVRLLNEDLVGQNERLETMDKVKSDFITIASHELRTPLTQVKGYADILGAMNEENALTRDQTRQIIDHITRATGQLEKLITAMLDASQIDVDEMHLTFIKTNVDTTLRLALEPLTKALRERRIQLVQEGIGDLPALQADFRRLVQAFTNIIGNAIKYTPDGGKITITGSVLGEGGEQFVQVAIADTGIGIDVAYQQFIFEKFFRIGDPQLHSTGSTKFMGAGPGLGLPIAKGVIEGHGGRIWVESEGEDMARFPGSTFTMILPLRPPKMPELPIPNALKELANSEERPPWLIG